MKDIIHHQSDIHPDELDTAGRIRFIRRHLKLSQRDFGQRLGVSRDVIVNLELDRAQAKPLFLQHLCQVYCVSLAWLCDGLGPVFSQQNDTSEDNGVPSALDREILESFMKLSPTDRQSVYRLIQDLIGGNAPTQGDK